MYCCLYLYPPISILKKKLLLNNLKLFTVLVGYSWFMNHPELYMSEGFSQPSIHLSILFSSFLFMPILKLVEVGCNWFSRKMEYEADAFAKTTTGNVEGYIHALKSLYVLNMGQLTPCALDVWMNYSHPPILDRIAALRK